jgi:protein dithiol oxidoreductase (disulfide-forming)
MKLFSLLTMLIAPVIGTLAVAADLKEGQDYLVIQSATPAEKSAKITVTEFFSYQCPHCFAFSQPLRDWSAKLPSDVQFERESVSIGHEAWIPIARSYYALRSIGKLEALDADIFNAIHQQGVRLNEVPYIMGWLNQKKVAPTEFDTAYRSQKTKDDYARGEQLSKDYKVPSIPVMVIDGKYLVIIESNIDFAQQLRVVDRLIERARATRAH